MTENEAINKIQYRINTASEIAGHGEDGNVFEDLEVAIQALEEIQQYRAIDTIEELAQLKSEYNRMLKFNDRQGKIIDNYEAIGTVEEFKVLKKQDYDCTIKHLTKECSYNETGCLNCKGKLRIKDLLEKNDPKKPNGMLKVYGDCFGSCPICNRSVTDYLNMPYKYCPNCGQSLNWQ